MANKNSVPAKRGRKKTTGSLNKKIVAKAITAVAKRRTMGAVSFANENNLNPKDLIARLKAEGVVIQRGRPRIHAVESVTVSA